MSSNSDKSLSAGFRKQIVVNNDFETTCKINEVCEIAKNKDLIVIEDSAEALGSTINGKKTGSVSDSAIFSFCGNKVLTTGEGGAVVTNSKTINEKIKSLRSHGRVDKINYFERIFEC